MLLAAYPPWRTGQRRPGTCESTMTTRRGSARHPTPVTVDHCVDAGEVRGSAWRKAEESGELPIQMWAPRPNCVMPRRSRASETALRAWFDNVARALACVRDEEKNA